MRRSRPSMARGRGLERRLMVPLTSEQTTRAGVDERRCGGGGARGSFLWTDTVGTIVGIFDPSRKKKYNV
jgi:hypothetical protein